MTRVIIASEKAIVQKQKHTPSTEDLDILLKAASSLKCKDQD